MEPCCMCYKLHVAQISCSLQASHPGAHQSRQTMDPDDLVPDLVLETVLLVTVLAALTDTVFRLKPCDGDDSDVSCAPSHGTQLGWPRL